MLHVIMWALALSFLALGACAGFALALGIVPALPAAAVCAGCVLAMGACAHIADSVSN